MLKPHLSYIAAISVHRRTSGYPWRGGSVRSDFQCRLLYLKTYGGSREVAEDDRSLLNSWRWSLGRSKWGVKCSDPNSRISVFWTTLMYFYVTVFTPQLVISSLVHWYWPLDTRQFVLCAVLLCWCGIRDAVGEMDFVCTVGKIVVHLFSMMSHYRLSLRGWQFRMLVVMMLVFADLAIKFGSSIQKVRT